VRTREERRAGQAMMLKQYIADTTHVTMRSSLAGRRTTEVTTDMPGTVPQ